MMLIRATPHYKNKLSFLHVAGYAFSCLSFGGLVWVFFRVPFPFSVVLFTEFLPKLCASDESLQSYQKNKVCGKAAKSNYVRWLVEKNFHPLKVRLLEHDLEQNIVGTFVRQTATFHAQMGILGLNCYL